MVMLTQVLRFKIKDEAGRHATVADLATELLEDDYPPITRFYFQQGNNTKSIGWDLVNDLDTRGGAIRVKDLGNAAIDKADGAVLLKRDILDSLILDLLGRRTTRVCDILLDANDGQLRMKAVDAGFGAMLRRIFGGQWPKVDRESMFDWKYVEFLRGDPDAVNNGAGYRMRIRHLPAGEIARLADYIPYLHAAELLKLLPDEKAADVLEATTIDRQMQVIEELGQEEAVNILCLMSPDLATDIVGRLDLCTMRRYLSVMSPVYRDRIVELLRYPEDSVGGAMTNDIIILAASLNCATAKEATQETVDTVHFPTLIFIVDDDESRRLRGAVRLKDLLAADNDRTLEDLMDPYLQTLSPYDNAGDAAYRIVGSQLLAMPVVNTNGRLIGAMTVEAAITRLLPPTSGVRRLKIYS
ncbi:MAG TPA: CBS domain-containing protein [Pyrinomonadaceae bacterium]|nr:CBS domain-containing protein [Pyrinomonadaceae bacterium]